MSQFSDGVYFGMPEATYHAIPRFSTSGVKHMIVSCLDFWTLSWMNPENAGSEVDDADDPTDTSFKLKGRAYHCRLMEGRIAFESRYGFKLAESDIPEGVFVYRTSEEIKEALTFAGVKNLSKMKKDGLIDTLLFYKPDAVIWEVEVKKHAEANAGRVLIPKQWEKEVELSAAMIERNPHLCNAFKGGFPEVTVLWTKIAEEYDEATGEVRKYKVPCKSRLDYIKPGVIVDYKTFGNTRGKSIRQAVIGAMAERKNHIQVAVYYEAHDALALAIKENRVWTCAGVETPMPWPIAAGVGPRATVAALANPAIFSFVFQQTGRAPVAVGRTMPRTMTHVDFGRTAFNAACVQFAKCLTTFGTDPWVHIEPVTEFDDLDFPIYMGDL